MTTDPSRPVTPTRIIPAGEPLPNEAPTGPPPPPPPPPAAPPPPSAPPPGDPGRQSWPWPAPPPAAPLEIRLTFDWLEPPEPEPTWRQRFLAWLRPLWTWRSGVALAAAVFPIPGVGYSAAGIWHYTVAQARDGGTAGGYAVGGGLLAYALLITTRYGATAPRLWLCTVAGIGALGALSWYDPIELMTGVGR